ncbi:unnamed protein product [Dibothriocephalus latus]|uniref:Uncharacterized protein n=1 Tax=Dibothriocephalus latus TaxID=60516 RepID=A0A3P7L0Y2_DIBLA|nr:unnamed protein product [Dibothriocephalus latus]
MDGRTQPAFDAIDLGDDGRHRTHPEIWSLLRGTYNAKSATANAEIDPEVRVRETMSKGLSTFKKLVRREAWLMESLLPGLPHDQKKLTFQTIFISTAEVPVNDRRGLSLRRSRKSRF